MRPILAVPVLAGLLVGWAALAQADAAPPAAPIFYCPTPGKTPPAAAAATGPAAPHVAPAAHHALGCPVARIPVAHHPRWRSHLAPPRHRLVVARGGSDNNVSASQAFIYRYERAMHGLDARAAQQAWAEGGSPCPPHRDHCWAGPAHAVGPGPGPAPGAMAHAGPSPHGMPPGPMAHAGPPPHGMPPGPPPTAHAGMPPGPPPGAMHTPPPAMAQAGPPPRPSVRAYAWNGGHSGYAIETERMSREREGGWSYSEVDGHARFHRWGDRFPGEPEMGGREMGGPGMGGPGMGGHWGGHWGGHPRPCPPPVPAAGCAGAHGGPPPEAYQETGRDPAGFLTWPGKTPAAW